MDPTIRDVQMVDATASANTSAHHSFTGSGRSTPATRPATPADEGTVRGAGRPRTSAHHQRRAHRNFFDAVATNRLQSTTKPSIQFGMELSSFSGPAPPRSGRTAQWTTRPTPRAPSGSRLAIRTPVDGQAQTLGADAGLSSFSRPAPPVPSRMALTRRPSFHERSVSFGATTWPTGNPSSVPSSKRAKTTPKSTKPAKAGRKRPPGRWGCERPGKAISVSTVTAAQSLLNKGKKVRLCATQVEVLRDACEKQRTDDEWKKWVRVVVVTGSIDVVKVARKEGIPPKHITFYSAHPEIVKEARKYIGERASLVKKINGKYRKIRLGADATDAGPSSFARQRSPLEDHPVVVFSLPSAKALAKKMEREFLLVGRVEARNLQLKELKEKHYHVEALEVGVEFLNKHPMEFRVKDVDNWAIGAFAAAVERDPETRRARLKETLVKGAEKWDKPSLMHLYALLFSTATRTSCAALPRGDDGLYAFDTPKGPRGFRAHELDKKGILLDEAKHVYKAYFTQYAQEKRNSRLGDCYRAKDIPWKAAILVTESKMRRCPKSHAEQTPCGRIVIFPERVLEHCGGRQGLVNVLNEALEVIISCDLPDDFGSIITRQTCDWILWSLCTTPEMRRRVDMQDLAVVRSLFAHWQLAKVATHHEIYEDKKFAGLVIYYCILHHYIKRQGKCKRQGAPSLDGEVRYPLPRNFDVEEHAGLVYGWAEYDKWWQTKRQDGHTGSQMYTATHNRNQYMYAEAF